MQTQARAAPGRKVLVIDDDEIALEAIRDVLARAGFQVQCLSSPIGATQVIMSQGIEAVVVDLNMPVMRGDRFISLLRSWDRIRDLPTVLISGSDAETLQAAASSVAGVQTVTKENMRLALPEALHRALSKDRAQGAARRPAELDLDTRRALARTAQGLSDSLASLHAERRRNWEPILTGFQKLREQAEPARITALSKVLTKAQSVVEYCARSAQLAPETRLALTRTLGTIATIEDTDSSTNLSALLTVHVTRLERLFDGLRK